MIVSAALLLSLPLFWRFGSLFARAGSRRSWLNPLVPVCIFLVVGCLDAILLSTNGVSILFKVIGSIAEADRTRFQISFAGFYLSSILGIYIASRNLKSLMPYTGIARDERESPIMFAVFIVFYIPTAIILLIMVQRVNFDLRLLSTLRQIYFREILAFTLLLEACLMAGVMALVIGHRRWLVALLLASILAAGVNRAPIMLGLFALGISLEILFRRTVKAWMLLAGSFALVFLSAVYMTNFRVISPDFDRDVMLSTLSPAERMLQGLDIAYADALAVAVATEGSGRVSRYPFESFFGAAIYLIPRDLIGGIKPFTASSDATAAFFPDRWVATGSEVVIGSFADLYYQFGNLGWIINAVIFWLWTSWVCSTLVGGRYAVAQGPVQFWVMFDYIRNDIQNASFDLWCIAVVWGLVLGLRALSTRRTSSTRRAASRGSSQPVV